MKRLFFIAAMAALFTGCGKAKSYPLRTCVVCDGPFPESGAIEFVYERQQVEVCSKEHHDQFLQEPERYLKKIAEVKVL